MVARSRGGVRFINRNSKRGQTCPYRPATGQQLEVPASGDNVERLSHVLHSCGGASINDPSGDTKKQALVPNVLSTKGGQWRD